MSGVEPDVHVFPLSTAQQGLWFLHQLEPENTVYNVIAAIELTGPVDVAVLERSFNDVVDRHEVMRTTFAEVGDSPLQVVLPELPITMQVVDLRALPEAERRDVAQQIAASVYLKPFDLAQGPLLRVLLARTGDAAYGLYCVTHHIVFDNWSLEVLYNELSAHYRGRLCGTAADLPELRLQFADYAHWQNQRMDTRVVRKQLAYWKQQLQNAPDVLEIPMARARPSQRNVHGGATSITLEASLTRGLRTLGRSVGGTLFMTVLAGFAALLYRYGSGTDLLIGTPTHTRTRRDLEPLIGYFINVLVLRVDLSGEPTVRELLTRATQVTLDALGRPDVPFEQLVETLRPDRRLSHTPLFQVVFDLHGEPTEALDLPGVRPRTATVEGGGVQKLGGNTADLNLSLGEQGDELAGSLEYSTDLFTPVQADRIVGHLCRLLEEMVARPDARISTLEVVTSQEREQLLFEWNPSPAPYPVGELLHHRIARWARERPDAVAVVTATGHLSYGALEARSNQLAHYLRSLGVGSESRVGLCLQRSLDQFVAFLAILKAGAAYVPLDPAHPGARITYMLEDAGIVHLLCDSDFEPPSGAVFPIELDRIADQLATQPRSDPGIPLHPENLIAVIYTSGSTGNPKGVMMRHRGLQNLQHFQREAWGFDTQERVLQFTSFSFDSALWETSMALGNGGALVLPDPDLASSPTDLAEFMADQGVTSAALPPTVLTKMARTLPSLRVLLSAGEACNAALVAKWAPGRTFVNSYGPTETTVCSTQGVCSVEEGTPTIGRPLANLRAYVLDPELRLVPAGVPGELYISGDGLARGDLARPGLTSTRFVPCPYAPEPGARMYRTGDVAKHREDGRLEFLGRVDHQVKLRGFRVELGEIEEALRDHPSVSDGVVIGKESDGGQVESLVAYIIPIDGTDGVPPATLQAHLLGRLPGYMVPSRFVFLERWPLTANGKVDRKALPGAESVRPWVGSDYVAPRTSTEIGVAEIWVEALDLDRVGVRDNFFEVGGHSLIAARIVAGIRDRFGVDVSLRDVFTEPVLEDLAALVERQLAQMGATPSTPVVPVPRDGALSLSFAQERLWFLDRLGPGDTSYNIPSAFRLGGPVAPVLLEKALAELTARHEVLRTSYPSVHGRPSVEIHVAPQTSLRLVDLRGVPGDQRESLCERLLVAEADHPFALERLPLWRPLLVRLTDDCHVLLLTLHHTIADGRSIELLVDQIGAIYRDLVLGADSEWVAPEVQYVDYAAWQRTQHTEATLDDQLAYWKNHLGEQLPRLDLPVDHPRSAVRGTQGGRVPWALSVELSEAVTELVHRSGTTMFMVWMAALNALLHRYSGQDDIVVGTPIANRSRTETARMVGFFVNTLPLRTHLGGDPTFLELLERVRATSLGAFAHQDTPFEKVVGALQPERDLSRNPLFDVLFVIDSDRTDHWALTGTSGRGVDVYNGQTKFDLTLWVRAGASGLAGEWEYSADLFEASTVERLDAHFRHMLAQVAQHPDRRLSELQLVSDDERQTLLEDWNRTEAPFEDEACLHTLFERQVARRPDGIALVVDHARVSYGALDARAEALASHLRALGVGPEVRVGVCLQRTTDLLVGLLAVLKAGGAYVPLDPNYPTERLRFLVEDARAHVVLVHDATREAMAGTGMRLLDLDHPFDEEFPRRPADWRPPRSGNAAYVIYTSGSTGRPKGVVLSHRSAGNLLGWARTAYAPEALQGVLAATSTSFDLSVFELFVPLSLGTTILLARDGLALADLLCAEEVTLVNTVPSVLAEMLRARAIPPNVRVVNVAGEPLGRGLAQQVHGLPGAPRLVNLYAPSETTTYSTSATISAGSGKPSIGRPIANTRVYLLDAGLEPVPVGVVGELYLAGEGVTRGYLQRPGLTAERYVPAPHGDGGGRLYATGDLARYGDDGALEFLGRRDRQVKLRGFRIELAEIEAALEEHPLVSAAALLDVAYAEADRRLVAYVVAGAASPSSSELRQFLASRLPAFLVPNLFEFLPAIPRTPNGKVDHSALPRPSLQSPHSPGPKRAPSGPIEEMLADLWCEVLRLDDVGADEDFFVVGGHSLLAVQLQARVVDALGVELGLVDVFRAPTITELAARVEHLMVSALDNLSEEEAQRLLDDAP